MKFYRQATLRIRLRKDDFTGYYRTIFITGLRVSFSIQKSLAWSTNSCIVRVWNLSQSNRNLIKDYGDEVTLYAGYERDGGVSVLFIGDTRSASHIYEQPDIITVLECGDGEKYINQLRVSGSFAANTPAKIIITTIAQQMGITLLPLPNVNNLVYRQGFVYNEMAKDTLTKVCDKLGLQWSVQNNALQIIPINGTIAQAIIQVNQNTGMQGVPTRFTYKRLDLYRATAAPTTGYKVNVALNPFIIPGAKIDLQSTHLNFRGPYRVENVRHEGDTFGFVWSSSLEVTELVTGSTLSALTASSVALGRPL